MNSRVRGRASALRSVEARYFRHVFDKRATLTRATRGVPVMSAHVVCSLKTLQAISDPYRQTTCLRVCKTKSSQSRAGSPKPGCFSLRMSGVTLTYNGYVGLHWASRNPLTEHKIGSLICKAT